MKNFINDKYGVSYKEYAPMQLNVTLINLTNKEKVFNVNLRDILNDVRNQGKTEKYFLKLTNSDKLMINYLIDLGVRMDLILNRNRLVLIKNPIKKISTPSQTKQAKLAHVLNIPIKNISRVKFTKREHPSYQILYYVKNDGFYFIWGPEQQTNYYFNKKKPRASSLFKNKKIYSLNNAYMVKAPSSPSKILKLARGILTPSQLNMREKNMKDFDKIYLPSDKWTLR